MNKIKKILSILTISAAVPFPVFAETKAEAEKITAGSFSEILVSFLYLAAVLALIYVILLLVDRWGKKNAQKQNKETANDEQSEAEAERDPDNVNESDKILENENTNDNGKNE